MTDIQYEVKLSKVFDEGIKNNLDQAIWASMGIIEKAYVDETPVDKGGFRQGIEIQRKGSLQYQVASTAERNGFNYPLALFTGTRRMYGLPDSGFTTGHVRAGTIAYGIGGIRPNKVAERARDRAEPKFMSKVNKLVANNL